MVMLMQIGQKPESGFEDPLGMLADCHKRILHFLDTLCTLAMTSGRAPLTDSEREALEDALTYFQTSGPRHTADEEESVFPRLRATRDPKAEEVLAKIASLEADHRWAERQHADVDVICRRWLAAGTLTLGDRQRLNGTSNNGILEPLMRFYEHHLKLEEDAVFPVVQSVLPASELEAIGREMAARRGVAFKS